MNGTLKKVLTWFVFPVIIVLLVIAIVSSILKPVNFNKETEARKAVAIQQMKDIRDLQVAYKGEYGKFAPTVDSLQYYYKNGDMSVLMQIGSHDDSVAVAHTDAVKKSFKNLKDEALNQALYQAYLAGDNNLVFTVRNKIAVKDTLFNNKAFDPEKLRYIPFSEGDTVIMQTIVKQVSGVDVPLFQAQMPFNSLLKGLDHQQIVNLNFERTDTDRYPGLMVGSIENANNNAGNWE